MTTDTTETVDWRRVYRVRWRVIGATGSDHVTGVYTALGDTITEAINASMRDVQRDYPGAAFTPVKARHHSEWDEPLD